MIAKASNATKSNEKPAEAAASTDNPAAETSTETKHHKKITRYNIGFTIFVLAWTIAATLLSQLMVFFALNIFLGDKILEPGWMLLYYILNYALSLFLIIYLPPKVVQLYRRNHKRQVDINAIGRLKKDLESTPTSMGVQNLPTFVDIGLAPIGYIVTALIAQILTTIMSAFSWFDANQAQDVGFSTYLVGWDRIFAILAVVIIAPIAEEFIMRGWLYGKVRRKWSAPIAIILVSLVFALLHGQWNVGVTVFALSIVLCSLREITGTIWSGILLHMLLNGITFYVQYIAI